MKNIDVTNGNVYLDGISYTVTKHLTRDEFERLDCLEKKGPMSEFKKHNVFEQYIELCKIGERMFYPRFFFSRI